MPSKGGSSQGAGGAVGGGIAAELLGRASRSTSSAVSGSMAADVLGSPQPGADLAAIGLSAEDLARPLRRGHEVERFNELARRQEELTLDELDELYRYRLRRLQSRLRRLDRVRAADDEDAIRATLDDFEGRLQDLRRAEEVRRAAGLSAGYELDLSSQAGAVDRLLELARRRPP